jgi:glutathione synthase/RimK-type ligase-like ATP-grasp enzyme
MVPCSAENLNILNDKALFYQALAQSGLSLPRWVVASNFEEFEKAVDLISSGGGQVCFKPTKSIFGWGFKIIRELESPLRNFLSNNSVLCELSEAKRYLNVPPDQFIKLLVMEYLPGPEYSLDCLAKNGQLIKFSIRKKSKLAGRPEKLVDDPALGQVAELLAKRFDLSWIFNLQFISSEDGPRLLEINPRMAGGLYFSCLAGINYPYWAIRLALESCQELIPEQKYHLYVNQFYQPFIWYKHY